VFRKLLEVKNCSPYPGICEIKSMSREKEGIEVKNGYKDCQDPDFLSFDKSKFDLKVKKKNQSKNVP
jgi:hypothetical protein